MIVGEDADGAQLLSVAAAAPLSGAIFRLARAHRTRAAELLRSVGLYAGQEMLMITLWERGEMRQSDLIATLGLDPSTVTRMVQRLAQTGFVVRRNSDTDRRVVMVTATRASLALRGKVEEAWRQLEAESTRGMTDEERIIALTVLGRIEEALTAKGSSAHAS